MSPLDPVEELGIEREALPRHIAIVMDGNGRWARQRGLPRLEGHREGAKSVRATVTHCARLGIEYLTLYAFSLENWKRPKMEVAGLMALYAEYLIKERDEIMENGIRVLHLGSRERLPDAVLRELDVTIEMCKDNKGLTVCLALNYASRAEIVQAVRCLARRVQAGALQPDEIDEAAVSNSLWSAGVPDPDLVIRTAGEMRLSNFLLWQISYAELCVVPTFWPDFRPEHLNGAIIEFAKRERRFGDVGPVAAQVTDSPG